MDYLQKTITAVPHTPGVYQFLDAHNEVLYVGKAKNLKNRLSQYAKPDAVPEKTRFMLAAAKTVKTIRTGSEFDALLLEAKLIHDLQPKYNVTAKDDKSPLYIFLSLDEELPHVELRRKPTASNAGLMYIGPFQSGKVGRELLRHLRRSIPFCTQKKRTGVPCFYTHIGLCSPCPSVIMKVADQAIRTTLVHQYRRNILRLRAILTGKSAIILHQLEREMQSAARAGKFENAAHIRNQIHNLQFLLEKRYDPTFYLTDTNPGERIGEHQTQPLLTSLQPIYPALTRLSRIECFDISNISGTSATGSMVVATNGIIDTSQYRKFRIHMTGRPNDGAMMEEMLTRRFSHREWPQPDLIVVDGGKPQLGEALNVIKAAQANREIPVIGLAKRREEIVVNSGNPKDSRNFRFRILRLPLTHPGLQLLQRLRDEAHRFAITYHRLLRARRV